MITAIEALEYLGPDSSYTEEEVQEILTAEAAAQAHSCRIPEGEDYPADLALALKRRVSRSLSMKTMHLGYQASATEFGQINTRIRGDLEVARLEAPYRRLVVG